MENLDDVRVLKRVPKYTQRIELKAEDKVGCIIDLETTGLRHNKDEITEIGIIVFVMNDRMLFRGILDTYNSLNEPQTSIPEHITKLTGITNELVKGQKIDWEYIKQIIDKTDLVICHNAQFDRKFLESQAPNHTLKKALFDTKFGCSKNDVDWSARGYGSNKLDYLNWKLGYFYDAHRALDDCWATLNILLKEEGAFRELITNSTQNTYEVYAMHAPFSTKDFLKENGYFWNTGENGKPKAWYTKTKDLEETCKWLKTNVGCETKYFIKNALNRYSTQGE